MTLVLRAEVWNNLNGDLHDEAGALKYRGKGEKKERGGETSSFTSKVTLFKVKSQYLKMRYLFFFFLRVLGARAR